MRVEYDRFSCSGWFQCVQEWDAFEMNVVEGKADLEGGEARDDGTIVREVQSDAEEAAKAAADECPVDAIVIYDDDGEQLAP